MAQVKIGQFKFGENTFKLRYVLENNNIVKFVAKDIAVSLKYENTKKAIIDHVDDKYKGYYFVTHASKSLVKQGDPLYLHPDTVLITKSGVIQLIMRSKLPYAVELQEWLLEEVIPQVLSTGKYQPAVEADDKIKQFEAMTVSLKETNDKLQKSNEKMIVFMNALVKCNNGLMEARKDAELARRDLQKSHDDFKDYANRVADIFKDVITKPSNPQLCHSLAVCALGNDEYAFLRAQKRSLGRSIKRLGSTDVVFSSDYVPNAMNVLNKVKESLPRNKYKAKHNKITLLENLTKEQLIEAVNSSMTERQIARLSNSNNNTL
ncbi:Baculovirus repeated orf A [Lonomia obliqua multiple nucleopolyhedrovirus]|uniref:Baculovirus repeated orf A n=1 Tax=Lonomia obliqua multiple nucleopolyhedrovirus TaxID=134394 RepID=A0A126FCD5_9ABAC|nr:Baculovirus repeated orf A [Lonomia obliqua multiple nucleopolyhedrovirus]AKN81062.1 Baculovirus repeated orf A [Lonomia obliqua multiple nucleopolyhedrovirus]